MSKFRNIKVYVPAPEISEAVQKKLFEDGCEWFSSGRVVSDRDYTYLFVESTGVMTRTSRENSHIFAERSNKEVPYQSILDPYYDIKIAWANGEGVQYRIKGADDWFDWELDNGIAISDYEEWRIKPKTKTIKQWEYKKTIFEGEQVYTVVFRNEALAMESYRDCRTAITKPTLVEYEVPND